MKNRLLFIVIAVLGITLAGCGKQNHSTIPLPPSSSVTTTDEIPTVGQDVMKEWKTYRNEKLRIEIQYPAGLRVQDNSTPTDAPIQITKENAPGSQTATLSFEKVDQGTNLNEAKIVGEYLKISEKKCIEHYQAMRVFSSDPKATSTIQIDGVTAYKTDALDPGAGNRYRTISYIAPFNNGCYVASLVLHSTERMNYEENERPTAYDPAFYIDTFEKMAARVKFIK